jgi:predicted nucleotidyltransferase
MGMSQRNKGSMDHLLAKAQQDEDILAVSVFGSVARGEEVDTSDVDICLFLMPQAIPF